MVGISPFLSLVLLGPVLTAAVALLLARYFRWEGSAPMRARLTTPRMRLLAIVVAFSPAITVALLTYMSRHLPLPPEPFLWISLMLGSFGATALAACWLMLSRDAARPLRPGRTVALAFAFWFANWGLLLFVLFGFPR